ncbi:MAG: hypothetical protein KZQ67_16985 [gamma proteobacterium symbiont of Bathyaustriella thionipta]|nr:hypothetical protein [gamma proteobacterium symbiont of Bathyaustriella thionipta]MCU7951678.1 hypothetical protein [gamma proteobacterium symbiont of Bathyaustriella thionipta]MCU7958275.1 hypothetical protein [gamma proteobacterium symbiont of Bathyaustriella thionipta]
MINIKIPLTLCGSVSNKLKLTEVDTRDLIISKKIIILVKYVGTIQVRYLDKVAFTGAIMVGDIVAMSSSLIKSME